MSRLPKVALVSTGGTIASRGLHGLDIQDYGAAGLKMLEAPDFVAAVPELSRVAEVVPLPLTTLPSTALGWAEWRALAGTIGRLKAEHPDLAGVVVTHGTSTLEETAYALSLTLPTDLPVVITGAQRPSTSVSADGPMNLVNAARVAGDPRARGLGVLVVANDEIHTAREVTKTSNGRLHTFQSPEAGPIGVADGDAVVFRRMPLRLPPPSARLDITSIATPPRVDVLYSHAGGDGAAVEAFLAAGARGIVAAGFAPGFTTPGEREALSAAIARGCTVVLSSRAGSGRAFPSRRYAERGFISAGDLLAHKARILLMFALAQGLDRTAIAKLFTEC